MTIVPPTDGAKMMFLIKRRRETSREELVAHWFKNHMPEVIELQQQQSDKGRPYAWRYIATLFDADGVGSYPWDGVAQLWYDNAWPAPEMPIGSEPTDSFQQKAEPYMPWATTEYIYIDGMLKTEPLTLNEPFPTTRSGFHKVTSLLVLKDPREQEAFTEFWLHDYAPRAAEIQREVGALRYVVNISREPDEPYAGMAELYFDNPETAKQYFSAKEPDDLERWLDQNRTLVLTAQTEMIGIP